MKLEATAPQYFSLWGALEISAPCGTLYSEGFLPLGGLLESEWPPKDCGIKAVPTAVAPKDWMKCLRFTPER